MGEWGPSTFESRIKLCKSVPGAILTHMLPRGTDESLGKEESAHCFRVLFSLPFRNVDGEALPPSARYLE